MVHLHATFDEAALQGFRNELGPPGLGQPPPHVDLLGELDGLGAVPAEGTKCSDFLLGRY